MQTAKDLPNEIGVFQGTLKEQAKRLSGDLYALDSSKDFNGISDAPDPVIVAFAFVGFILALVVVFVLFIYCLMEIFGDPNVTPPKETTTKKDYYYYNNQSHSLNKNHGLANCFILIFKCYSYL
ncbi:hypothetical protein [Alphaproteobacteria bacterium endosymbiont of Tiliacea citrago]|uniref:hypothetical protein n=1 Tax=Alphaproteobacteria bacterium endosymbiont of Tiliacea citrago TaxID=3077944 RepID=UPI00313E490C